MNADKSSCRKAMQAALEQERSKRELRQALNEACETTEPMDRSEFFDLVRSLRGRMKLRAVISDRFKDVFELSEIAKDFLCSTVSKTPVQTEKDLLRPLRFLVRWTEIGAELRDPLYKHLPAPGCGREPDDVVCIADHLPLIGEEMLEALKDLPEEAELPDALTDDIAAQAAELGVSEEDYGRFLFERPYTFQPAFREGIRTLLKEHALNKLP